MGYVSGDGRELVVNQFNFGDYEIASAMCSNGDVIENFYNKDVLSILLADTIGHDKEKGDGFKEYLSRVREHGWGFDDAEKSLEFLSYHFPRHDHEFEKTEWSPVGGLLRLDKDSFQIANAGIEKPLYFHDGIVEKLDLNGNLEFYNRADHSPAYFGNMKPGEIVVLQSDGIKENADEIHGINAESHLENIIKFGESSKDIVSKVVDSEGLGRYCLPRDDEYDDISIVVVKKN